MKIVVLVLKNSVHGSVPGMCRSRGGGGGGGGGGGLGFDPPPPKKKITKI